MAGGIQPATPYGAGHSPAGQTVTIHLHPTERRRRADLVQHIVPALTLCAAGVSTLTGASRALSVIDIIAGLAALAMIVREFRKPGSAERTTINWLELAVGAMLLLEAWEMHHPTKIFQPALLYGLVAVFTIGRGAFHHRIPQLRVLRIDGEGFFLRTSPFRKVAVRWRNVARLAREEHYLVVHFAGGKTASISLRRVSNEEEVLGALRAGAAQMGMDNKNCDI